MHIAAKEKKEVHTPQSLLSFNHCSQTIPPPSLGDLSDAS
jgi:hypothetical protein